jgi:beta-galactosidase
MELNDFAQVPLPRTAVTESNPPLSLDYWRFATEQILAFDRMQAEIIRGHSPGRFVTHNFMGLFLEFDHWPFGEHLDFASWDSYPIGFTERFPFSVEEKVKWAEVSHPDMAAFHHDLYRGVGRGRWWVMEQQPGPVNWAPWNAVPKPGMVRLWTWQALAHGAECVSYFRWRQAPFAQEQFHAGLNLPNNGGLSPGGEEASQVGAELKEIGALPAAARAPIALVFDYESSWMTRIQPQGADFDYLEMAFRWYEAVRKCGHDVDILPPGAPLDGYALVLVPALMHVSDRALGAFKGADGVVLYGPRTGSKTRHQAIPENLPPGALQELVPMRITQVSSLRPGVSEPVWGRIAGRATRWREWIEPGEGTKSIAQYTDDRAAAVRKGNHVYAGFWADGPDLDALIDYALHESKLKRERLPEGVRLRRRGDLTVAVNFGEETWTLPAAARRVMGGRKLAPRGVAIWR